MGVKVGVDPTGADIHLGPTVVIRKLKRFKEMGQTAIFLIGDLPAMVGDPRGQSETRPSLSREQVHANAKTYLDKALKIIDPTKTEVRYNSGWLGKLTSYDIIKLCAYPLARMLEREDFRSRLAAAQEAAKVEAIFQSPAEHTTPITRQSFPMPSAGKVPAFKRPASISVHELLYPLFQAYDSVALSADVELGAGEQKFNLLMGREIQREYGQESQVCMTMPILVGLDGQRKMSKSLGNYVGITEPPSEMFGKLMSISDDFMWHYWDVLTDHSPEEIGGLLIQIKGGKKHPMDVKMQLAQEVIAGLHGEDAARKAAEKFQREVRDKQLPEDMPVRKLPRGEARRLTALLVELALVASRSDADRLVKQGGVELDGARVSDVKAEVDLAKPREFLLRAGKKKFVRLVVERFPDSVTRYC